MLPRLSMRVFQMRVRLIPSLFLMLFLACQDPQDLSDRPPSPPRSDPPEPPAGSITLVGAGDIADCGETGATETADLLDTIPGTIFTTGDNAYPDGAAEDFAECYEPTWGRHKERTRPSVGNHDYHTPNGAGYYGYFGNAAGEPGKGYYSYNVGAWHVIALNSELVMGAGSAQLAWLEGDLAASDALCTVAYWHLPRYSSGLHGSYAELEGVWRALYDAGVEIVLGGHDHHYERFAPQTPWGVVDTAYGIRQFVVGTGGGNLRDVESLAPHSEVYDSETYGLLALTLADSSYEWEFIPVEGQSFRDRCSADCHGAP